MQVFFYFFKEEMEVTYNVKFFFFSFKLRISLVGEGDYLICKKQTNCGGMPAILAEYVIHRDASR